MINPNSPIPLSGPAFSEQDSSHRPSLMDMPGEIVDDIVWNLEDQEAVVLYSMSRRTAEILGDQLQLRRSVKEILAHPGPPEAYFVFQQEHLTALQKSSNAYSKPMILTALAYRVHRVPEHLVTAAWCGVFDIASRSSQEMPVALIEALVPCSVLPMDFREEAFMKIFPWVLEHHGENFTRLLRRLTVSLYDMPDQFVDKACQMLLESMGRLRKEDQPIHLGLLSLHMSHASGRTRLAIFDALSRVAAELSSVKSRQDCLEVQLFCLKFLSSGDFMDRLDRCMVKIEALPDMERVPMLLQLVNDLPEVPQEWQGDAYARVEAAAHKLSSDALVLLESGLDAPEEEDSVEG